MYTVCPNFEIWCHLLILIYCKNHLETLFSFTNKGLSKKSEDNFKDCETRENM